MTREQAAKISKILEELEQFEQFEDDIKSAIKDYDYEANTFAHRILSVCYEYKLNLQLELEAL